MEKISRTHDNAVRPMAGDSSLHGEDQAIVQKVLQGDREAFRLIVEKYQGKVFNLALRYTGNDRGLAADASQEIFLRVFRGLSTFQQNAKFSTWLHRVAVNHLISEIRKERAQKRGRPVSLDTPLGDEDGETLAARVGEESGDPVRKIGEKEKGEAILHAIESLDEPLRLVVVMRELQKQSYEEMAEILEVPVGTVRSRLHRAREVLQAKLRPWLKQ